MRAVPAEAVALITEFEKFEPRPYLPTPNDVPTIGYGHTRGVKLTDPAITEPMARDLLRADMRDAVETLYACAGVARMDQYTENQYAALVSFVFNCGLPADAKKTRRAIAIGDLSAIRILLPQWNKQKGKVLNGLIRRRAAELALFNR